MGREVGGGEGGAGRGVCSSPRSGVGEAGGRGGMPVALSVARRLQSDQITLPQSHSSAQQLESSLRRKPQVLISLSYTSEASVVIFANEQDMRCPSTEEAEETRAVQSDSGENALGEWAGDTSDWLVRGGGSSVGSRFEIASVCSRYCKLRTSRAIWKGGNGGWDSRVREDVLRKKCRRNREFGAGGGGGHYLTDVPALVGLSRGWPEWLERKHGCLGRERFMSRLRRRGVLDNVY